VLETPTHEGAGHGWPPEQRADASARAAAVAPTPYVSGAYPYRLYPWPRMRFWPAVGALALALLSFSLLSTKKESKNS
jgi:hypothetical protein